MKAGKICALNDAAPVATPKKVNKATGDAKSTSGEDSDGKASVGETPSKKRKVTAESGEEGADEKKPKVEEAEV